MDPWEDHSGESWRTYLVPCGNQTRFVHVVSSFWEGEEDSNHVRNLLSSQDEEQSGAWSPSEPLVNTFEAEEFRMQVTWWNRRQLR